MQPASTNTNTKYFVPTIPPASTVEDLRVSVYSGFKKIIDQFNGQPVSTGSGFDFGGGFRPTGTRTTINNFGSQPVLNTFIIGTREEYAGVTFYGPSVNNNNEAEIGLLSVDETDVGHNGAVSTLALHSYTVIAGGINTSRYGKRLQTIVITSSGSGYQNNALVGFSGGTGTGALGKITVNSTGGITGAIVIEPGFGYKSTPTTVLPTPGTLGVLTPIINSFIPGDYIVWNDGGYEINQIASMSGTSTFTFATVVTTTGSTTTTSRRAFYLSSNVAHSTATFYQATPYIIRGGVQQASNNKYEAIHPNKCVLAAWSPGNNPSNVVNLNHSGDTVAAPGLRTMNGAGYILGCGTGTITVGQHADYIAPIQSWETFRFMYGHLGTAAVGISTGTNAFSAALLYLYPTSGSTTLTATVGLLNFGDAVTLTYSPTVGSFPDGQNMPAVIGGNASWPPNLFNVSGGVVQMTPDGWLDLKVLAVGTTTAGGSLVAVFQT